MDTFTSVSFKIVAGGEPAKYAVRDGKAPKYWRYQCELEGIQGNPWVSLPTENLQQGIGYVAREVFRHKPENAKFYIYWVDALVDAPGVSSAESPPADSPPATNPGPFPVKYLFTIREEALALRGLVLLLFGGGTDGGGIPAAVLAEQLKALIARDGIARMCAILNIPEPHRDDEPRGEELPVDEDIPF